MDSSKTDFFSNRPHDTSVLSIKNLLSTFAMKHMLDLSWLSLYISFKQCDKAIFLEDLFS